MMLPLGKLLFAPRAHRSSVAQTADAAYKVFFRGLPYLRHSAIAAPSDGA